MSRNNEIYIKTHTGELVTPEERYRVIMLVKFLIILNVISWETGHAVLTQFEVVFV